MISNDNIPVPKYKLGDQVKIVIRGAIDGVSVEQVITVFVRGMTLESSDREIYISYGLSTGLPAPFVSGAAIKWWKRDKELLPIVDLGTLNQP